MIPTIDELFDTSHCPVPLLLQPGDRPWTPLTSLGEAMQELVARRSGYYTEHSPGVFVGPGTTVAPSACLLGPAVIGANCEIRHGAFVRDRVIAGDDCVIGNSTELKNCILFDRVQVPHFSYVGDSILGFKAHLGAGVILSNVRLDGREVTVTDPDSAGPDAESRAGRIATGLAKFGALIGDRTEIGCNSVVNPGTIIGRDVVAYPLTFVRGIVAAGAIITHTSSR